MAIAVNGSLVLDDEDLVIHAAIDGAGLALAAAATLANAADYKIMVPAAPGGGYDQLGRAVQASMQASGVARRVQVNNAAGAGGTIGLAQLINSSKGDPGALMVSGKGMVSAQYINNSPVTISNTTPIARLTGEFVVLVVGKDGKRIAAIEVMLNTPYITELVKKGDVSAIKEAIVASSERGVQSFDVALLNLYKQNRIELEEALANADSRSNLEAKINFG